MIAPHEYNEVRLVLGGNKPLACIEKQKDSIGYSLAIALGNTGALSIYVKPTEDCPIGEVVFTAVHNKHLIARYLCLLSNGVVRYGIKEYHRKLGRLFGYSEQDIKEFIEQNINCECSKCRG